jgi:membrane fusion protein (multidrug efflux system)
MISKHSLRNSSVKQFSLIAGAALTFLTSLSACSKEEETKTQAAPMAVTVAKVEQRDLPRSVEYVGQTRGAVDAEVRARVEGIITGIHFEEGKEVKEGQLLFTIDPAPFEAKLSEEKAKLASAETQLTKAESDLKRIRPLAAMNAVSKRDLDTAVAQEGSAREAVVAAKAVVHSAELVLGYATITAPVSGVIGLSKAKVGEFVGRIPNPVVLATISQLDPIHVRFSINEKDYLFFARKRESDTDNGQEPPKRKLELILADGSLHKEVGEVVSTEAQIDSTTGGFVVEAAFPNPTKLLRTGLYAKVRAVAEVIPNAMLIPKRAIRDLQGEKQVFVVGENNTVEQRTIKTGAEVDSLVVVESGLSPNDQVAVDGIQRLSSGMVVQPRLAQEG